MEGAGDRRLCGDTLAEVRPALCSDPVVVPTERCPGLSFLEAFLTRSVESSHPVAESFSESKARSWYLASAWAQIAGVSCLTAFACMKLFLWGKPSKDIE